MATPKTGRPRGRPRKPKPEENSAKLKRGRQKLDPLADPDRYAVALIRALTAIGIANERPAAETVAAFINGNEISSGTRSDGMVFISFEMRNVTVAGRYSTLKKKLDRNFITQKEAEWHLAMSTAFTIALGAKHPLELHQIMTFARAVGEDEFAKRVLIPMAKARISGDLNMQDMAFD
jgi:hypothetical protein